MKRLIGLIFATLLGITVACLGLLLVAGGLLVAFLAAVCGGGDPDAGSIAGPPVLLGLALSAAGGYMLIATARWARKSRDVAKTRQAHMKKKNVEFNPFDPEFLASKKMFALAQYMGDAQAKGMTPAAVDQALREADWDEDSIRAARWCAEL